jgi:phosphate transport system permease protein
MSVDLGTRPVAPQQGNPLTVKTLPRFAAIYAAIVGVAVALLLNVLTSVQGVAGTAVVAALVFAAGQTVWSFMVEGRRHAVDRLATTLVYAAFLAALVALIAILAVTVVKGIDALNVEFLQRSMRNVSPQKQGGGIYHALIGTIEQVLIAALIAVPAGILTAIYLVEYGGRGRLGKAISFFVDVMTGIPSIIAGLFIYTFWVLTLGFQRSGFAGALALVILMIPVVVRSTEEMLKIVPNELREASYARNSEEDDPGIVLPTAIGASSPASCWPSRGSRRDGSAAADHALVAEHQLRRLSGPQASLPTFVWTRSRDRGIPCAGLAGALVLIVLMILYLGARIVAKFFAPKSE